jgi:hypothetical protein
MHEALESTQDPDWVLSHEGYTVLSESALESRLAFGNGFLGMRAARSVSRGPTWVACLLSLADRAAGLQLLRLSLDRDGVDVRLEASFAMAWNTTLAPTSPMQCGSTGARPATTISSFAPARRFYWIRPGSGRPGPWRRRMAGGIFAT